MGYLSDRTLTPKLGVGAFFLGIVLLVRPGGAEESPAWNQWRGPTRDGRFVGPEWPPSLAEEHLRQRWRIPLSESYSGPILTRDRIFTTETRDKQDEVVTAFDRETGKEVWRVSWKGAMSVPFFAASNGSWIRSTPFWDGETLYVAGMRDHLVALDATSGQERWRIDFVERFGTPVPGFGFVSSPLVEGDHVYVQAALGVCKIEKQTGKVVWRVAVSSGGGYDSAFSSPIVVTLGGKPQLVVQSRQSLMGLDLETGTSLWSRDIEAFRGMNILTPAHFEDALFTSAHSGRSVLLRVSGSEEVTEVWTNKAQAYMSSPVVIGGHVYMHLKNQRFTCLDLRSGEEQWRSRTFGKYCSLIAQRDRILALDERGDLLLIHATPKQFELIDERHISDDPAWAHLAVQGRDIAVRELNALTLYHWE